MGREMVEAKKVRELGICQIIRANGCTLKSLEKLLKLSVLCRKTSLSESWGKVWGPGLLVENYWCNEKKNGPILALEPICKWFYH